MGSKIETILNQLYTTYAPLNDGKVADYIPELARANSAWFGIAIVTINGDVYTVGDAKRDFTIQSLSKVVTYAMALQDLGRDEILKYIGVEPAARAFNAIALDAKGRPYNPMLNAGAIAIADLIKGADITEKFNHVLDCFEHVIGRELTLDGRIFTSERQTGHRNRALAYLMRASGSLQGSVNDTLDLYFQQCSLLVNAVDLATIAATLANDGINPISGEQAIDKQYIGDVLSVMYTCGMYDSSGEWAYRVGMPAKSGVSGGLIAVAPGRMGIGIFSPPLDVFGHSVRGVKVCEDLSQRLCLHIFTHCDDEDV